MKNKKSKQLSRKEIRKEIKIASIKVFIIAAMTFSMYHVTKFISYNFGV